ncbi:glycoside hydrolase family 2 protein [Halomontanus rarus]|uniref:glycoside hydrolase family 2 protein n=1 Tax=Halomontanus rarus TaxID=3034020 RepID=UPI0023E889D0|nr:glycoside hydrolase family 2 TIM barrel-domain containing protein [Halovivax sp. TS33]
MHLLTSPRETVSLDGEWQAIPDQYEMFREYFEDFTDDDVPGFDPIYEPNASLENDPVDFNIYDGYSVRVPSSWGEEIPEFRHYEGWVWYAKQFDRADIQDGNRERTFLRFGAVNYRAEVWLNGERLGDHEGGFTPFSFEITDRLVDGENVLVVRVDNQRYEKGIPDPTTDWFNFGGINRSVELVTVPEPFVRNYKVETTLSGGDDTVRIAVAAWIGGSGGDTDTGTPVSVTLPELGLEADLSSDADAAGDADGPTRYHAELSVPTEDVTLWNPSDPRLYTVELECGDDRVEDRVGLREIRVDDGDILLNGEPIWLRGVSLHEEAAGKGRALEAEDVETRFRWLNELGCNFARLAHYPHTEAMARTADEEGILLWEEVPAYWDVKFGDETVQQLYRQQLRELIQRDWNRASVALWSIANETDHTDEVRNEVLPEMAAFVRERDDSRLVTAACFVDETDDRLAIRDPLADDLDVIGINEYYGWYYGDAETMHEFRDDPTGTPVVISETGGGAKWGHHGDEDERWTEEFQAAIYRGQTRAIADIEQISGLAPWILFDFRAPLRQNEYQRGYNRKGLLDQYGRKKAAFSVLERFYRARKENAASDGRSS